MSSKEKLNTLIGADGQTLSPTLPENIKNYLIDIDGTITEDVPNEEPERMLTCLPFPVIFSCVFTRDLFLTKEALYPLL